MVKEQEGILNMMIKGIRRFVLDKIVPEYRGIRAHSDSTTGLGTSIYADGRETLFLTDIRFGKLSIMRDPLILKLTKAYIFQKKLT